MPRSLMMFFFFLLSIVSAFFQRPISSRAFLIHSIGAAKSNEGTFEPEGIEKLITHPTKRAQTDAIHVALFKDKRFDEYSEHAASDIRLTYSKGEKSGLLKAARGMKEQQISTDLISAATGLSAVEIEAIN